MKTTEIGRTTQILHPRSAVTATGSTNNSALVFQIQEMWRYADGIGSDEVWSYLPLGTAKYQFLRLMLTSYLSEPVHRKTSCAILQVNIF
jgi:hypothetical protein